MGTINHHAIVVTGFDDAGPAAHAEAIARGLPVTSLGPDSYGWRSFLVCPDGSKEGREHSDEMNRLRADFMGWLDGQGSTTYVETYQPEEGPPHITRDDGWQNPAGEWERTGASWAYENGSDEWTLDVGWLGRGRLRVTHGDRGWLLRVNDGDPVALQPWRVYELARLMAHRERQPTPDRDTT